MSASSEAAPPVAPPHPRGGRGRRPVAVTGTVALLVAAVTGTASFFGWPTMPWSGGAATDCGWSDCLPGLDGNQVRDILKAQHFVCSDESLSITCTYNTRYHEYTVSIYVDDVPARVRAIKATTTIADGDGDGTRHEEMTRSLFAWTVLLTMGSDPAAVKQVDPWVAARLRARQSSTARLGDHVLKFEAKDGDQVSLDVEMRTR